MKNMKISLIICIFLFIVTWFFQVVAVNIAPTSKIQGAFWGIKPVEQGEKQLRLLKQYGLNTALVNDSGHKVKENIWPGWGKIAEKYGIRLFPIYSFAGTDETKVFKGQFTLFVNRDGMVFPSTPCPLDARYWSTSITKRFEQLAYISKFAHISGLLFDTEMYGGDFSIYEDLCFCDVCWKEFIQTEPFFFSVKDRTVYNLDRKKRFKYLVRQRLLRQYADYQEKQIEEILTPIEKQIHSINPDLLLGFLGYRNNWFYRGLIRGLGTQTRPVLVFSESSYIRGYTPYVMQEKAAIKELRRTETSRASNSSNPPIARYVPGLWQGRFFPDDIPSQLYNLAAHTDGYWIFSADSLWDDTQKTGHYTLHGSRAEYWAAFKKANDELRRFANSPDTHKSSFSPVYLSSFYDPVQNHLITQPSLRHFLYHVLPEFLESARNQDSGIQPAPDVIYRSTTLFHGLNRPEYPVISRKTGQSTGTIQITHISLGFYPDLTTYKLFNEQGTLLQKGTLGKQTPSTTLILPPDVSGIFSLIIESGANLTKVTFSGLPFVVEASNTFPLKTFNTEHTYAVYIKPEKRRLTLRAYCSSSEETALIIVQSPEDRIHKETEIVEFTEMNIPVSTHHEALTQAQNGTHANPQLSLQLISGQAVPVTSKREGHIFWNNPNFWALAITPVPSKPFEDIQFYLYNEEFPYLITRNLDIPENRQN